MDEPTAPRQRAAPPKARRALAALLLAGAAAGVWVRFGQGGRGLDPRARPPGEAAALVAAAPWIRAVPGPAIDRGVDLVAPRGLALAMRDAAGFAAAGAGLVDIETAVAAGDARAALGARRALARLARLAGNPALRDALSPLLEGDTPAQWSARSSLLLLRREARSAEAALEEHLRRGENDDGDDGDGGALAGVWRWARWAEAGRLAAAAGDLEFLRGPGFRGRRPESLVIAFEPSPRGRAGGPGAGAPHVQALARALAAVDALLGAEGEPQADPALEAAAVDAAARFETLLAVLGTG